MLNVSIHSVLYLVDQVQLEKVKNSLYPGSIL